MKICLLRLDGVRFADVARYARILPTDRRQKIERLRFDSDKLLSLGAGLLIRREIGEVPLRYNEHGKPYAVGSDLFFSVSHSGDRVVIAVDDEEIGADIEAIPVEKEYMKIAERFYHPNERMAVENADDPAVAFTRVWTCKEAYLKQIGVGIATDLKAIDTTSDALEHRLRSFFLQRYVISVCAGSPMVERLDYSELELKDILT